MQEADTITMHFTGVDDDDDECSRARPAQLGTSMHGMRHHKYITEPSGRLVSTNPTQNYPTVSTIPYG